MMKMLSVRTIGPLLAFPAGPGIKSGLGLRRSPVDQSVGPGHTADELPGFCPDTASARTGRFLERRAGSLAKYCRPAAEASQFARSLHRPGRPGALSPEAVNAEPFSLRVHRATVGRACGQFQGL